jgi:hypothetical protein
MIDQIESRLTLAQLTLRTQAATLGFDPVQAAPVIAAARAATAAGTIGYGLLTAAKLG